MPTLETYETAAKQGLKHLFCHALQRATPNAGDGCQRKCRTSDRNSDTVTDSEINIFRMPQHRTI
jgi:hypothetical protein